MRIAYLINQYPTVSHSFIRREILALERLGFEVIRISIRRSTNPIVDEEDLAEEKRTRCVLQAGGLRLLTAVATMFVTRPRSFFRVCGLAWRMGRRSERAIPIHFIYIAEACQVALWLQEHAVHHLHAHFGTNSAEVAMYIGELGGPEWSFTIHGPEEFDKAPLLGLDEKIRRCAFVVGISSYTLSQICYRTEHKYWPKVHVVHCGLERRYFEQDERLPVRKRLVCVGRLCEQKGQLVLLEALRKLNDKGIEFEMILVGDGNMRKPIEELIRKYDLDERVRITGWISGQRVLEEISSAQALVLPSFAEGLPVVIMEAMALRRPVISTYVAGIPELVESGRHGWLVPAGDVEGLADAIQTLLSAPRELGERMGKLAHERALSRHSIDSQALLLAKLFRGSGGSPAFKINCVDSQPVCGDTVKPY